MSKKLGFGDQQLDLRGIEAVEEESEGLDGVNASKSKPVCKTGTIRRGVVL